jgi:hypothetical protein
VTAPPASGPTLDRASMMTSISPWSTAAYASCGAARGALTRRVARAIKVARAAARARLRGDAARVLIDVEPRAPAGPSPRPRPLAPPHRPYGSTAIPPARFCHHSICTAHPPQSLRGATKGGAGSPVDLLVVEVFDACRNGIARLFHHTTPLHTKIRGCIRRCRGRDTQTGRVRPPCKSAVKNRAIMDPADAAKAAATPAAGADRWRGRCTPARGRRAQCSASREAGHLRGQAASVREPCSRITWRAV